MTDVWRGACLLLGASLLFWAMVFLAVPAKAGGWFARAEQGYHEARDKLYGKPEAR